jgi:hypothetical protein
MEDYAEFIETLVETDIGINILEEAKEITDFFDETYDYLME